MSTNSTETIQPTKTEAAPAEVKPEAQPQVQPEEPAQDPGRDWETERAIYQEQLRQKDAIIEGVLARQPQAETKPQPEVKPDDPFVMLGKVVEEKVSQALNNQFTHLKETHTQQQQFSNFKEYVAKELPGKNADLLTPMVIQNAAFIRDSQGVPEQIAIKQAIDFFKGGATAPAKIEIKAPVTDPKVLQSSTDYGTQVGRPSGVMDKLEQASKDLEALYKTAITKPSGDSTEIEYSRKANAFREELGKAKTLGIDTSRYELKLKTGWK